MAKQIGSIQFRGKMGDYSGYVVKGKTGAVIRSINPNMSSRVKTESEFENTRLYAEQFRLVKFFSNWAASALRPENGVVNGKKVLPNYGVNTETMNKELYQFLNAYIAEDSSREVGKRRLMGEYWQKELCYILNKYSRMKYFNSTDFVTECSVVDSGSAIQRRVRVGLSFTKQMLDSAAEQGFKNVEIRVDIYSAEYAPISDTGVFGLRYKKQGKILSKSFPLTSGVEASGQRDFADGFQAISNGDNKGHIYCMKYTFYKGAVSEDKARLQNTGYFCWSGDIE